MFAGLLNFTLAFAGEDATGARPGLGAPVLEWKPVLELRTGFEVGYSSLPELAGEAWKVAGRVGIDAERKALRARLSLGARATWLGEEATWSEDATLAEAWVRWSPPISSALGLEFTGGLQPVEWDEGAVLADDDLRLDGAFPFAGRVRIRALPWEMDLASGFAYVVPPVPEEGSVLVTRPFHAIRLGAGRDNPSSAWSAGAIAVLLDPIDSADLAGRDPFMTTGVTASAALGRLRVSADGYLQPTTGAPAPMASGQLGWALGDDARVVLASRFDWLGGGDSPVFYRPQADTQRRFGWLGLFENRGAFYGRGAMDAALTANATIAPALRLDAAFHHLWDGTGVPLGGELDADLKWYFSPLAAVHLRGGAFTPWSNGDPVRIQGAVTIDASL